MLILIFSPFITVSYFYPSRREGVLNEFLEKYLLELGSAPLKTKFVGNFILGSEGTGVITVVLSLLALVFAFTNVQS